MSPADKAVAALERFHCGDYETAVHLFEEVAQEQPTTEILNDLGYAQQTCGHIQEAERCFREALTIAQQQAGPLLDRLHKLIEVDLADVEKQMNARGAPWTPGRIPQ